MITLPKKRNLQLCQNYRTISLISLYGKFFQVGIRSESASGDDGCLEKVIDSWMKTIILRRGHGDGPYVLWCNSGCKGSWILKRALTPVLLPLWPCFSPILLLVPLSLLPIPLALNCRTLNMLSLLICSADGAGVGDDEGGGGVNCWVFEAEQGSQVQSSFFRYCDACTHPEHLVHR